MTDIILTKEDPIEIEISNSESSITVSNEYNEIVISKVGVQGADGKDGVDGTDGVNGVGVPVGGATGQVLAKIDGTDYNTGWVDDANIVTWIDLAGDVEYTGVETAIASGEVLTADYKGATIYRFINSTENANGYPSEDSFYSNFDGTNLTNKIVQRGQ